MGAPETKDTNMMEFDDVIESDGQEFVVLPEGDYTFTVTSIERGHFPGGQKIPSCNKVTVMLAIDNDQGIATARVDLILYRTVEWKIASFFRCIGQKKYGEKMAMNWNNVIGTRGKAHFKPREYEKDGQTRQVNDVTHFFDYDPSVAMIPVSNEELPWENGEF